MLPKDRKTRNQLLIIIILVVFFTILLISRLTRPRIIAKQLTETAITVQAIHAKPGAYQPHLTLYGTVRSPRLTTIETEVAAKVQDIAVKEGDSVIPGQVLVTLDQSSFKHALTRAEAAVNTAKANIAIEKARYHYAQQHITREQTLLNIAKKDQQRFQRLLNNKTIAPSRYEQSVEKVNSIQLTVEQRLLALNNHQHQLTILQAALKEKQASLDEAKLNIKRCTIRAPFAAKVVRLMTSKASFVHVNEPVIKLFDKDATEVWAYIPDKYIASFKQALNQQQSLQATSLVDEHRFNLKLLSLSAEVKPDTAGLNAVFTVDTRQAWLEINRHIVVHVSLPKLKNIIALPQSAIFQGNYIYVIKQDRLRKMRVKIKGYQYLSGKPYTLINADNIPENTEILSSHIPNAVDGLLVVVEAG